MTRSISYRFHCWLVGGSPVNRLVHPHLPAFGAKYEQKCLCAVRYFFCFIFVVPVSRMLLLKLCELQRADLLPVLSACDAVAVHPRRR